MENGCGDPDMVMKKFFADSMLGKMAKWLRLMGFYVEYANSTVTDDEILDHCIRNELFLVTRDKELSKRYEHSMYMPSDQYREQIRTFLGVFPPDSSLYFTRCPVCNGAMKTSRTADYPGEIPDGVRRRHEKLYICTECGKVYWEGTHFDAISETIRELVKGENK